MGSKQSLAQVSISKAGTQPSRARDPEGDPGQALSGWRKMLSSKCLWRAWSLCGFLAYLPQEMEIFGIPSGT